MKKGNGISFYNKNLDLPTMANGKSILYKEYRIKPIVNDNNVHRIVVGSDGSYYYTNTHYGDTIRNNSSSGIPFYKAGKLPQGTIKQIFGDIQ